MKTLLYDLRPPHSLTTRLLFVYHSKDEKHYFLTPANSNISKELMYSLGDLCQPGDIRGHPFRQIGCALLLTANEYEFLSACLIDHHSFSIKSCQPQKPRSTS